MSVSSPLETMFWLILICTLQSMFHITRGCVAEERIALLRIRSLLIEANHRVPASLGQYEVPASWGQSDDCFMALFGSLEKRPMLMRLLIYCERKTLLFC